MKDTLSVGRPELPAVNWHITNACNFSCIYCDATFSRMPPSSRISEEDGRRIITMLAAAGVDKINFVGGEPTLHPHLLSWVSFSRSCGLTTAMITNGAKLVSAGGHAVLEYLDWCGLSLDSGSPATQAALGRKIDDPVAFAGRFSEIMQSAGVASKLNSVVTQLNIADDLTELVRTLNPKRWKIFQYLPVQDERCDQRLEVTNDEFGSFVRRHAGLCPPGVMAWEDNDRMIGSYVMIDPFGRFFDARRDDNGAICRTYSSPILDGGVVPSLSALNYDVTALKRRGGLYDWRER